MATLKFENMLCLNDMPVLVVKETMPISDPYDLSGDFKDLSLEDELEVDMVTFKAASDVLWMTKALGLKTVWWIRNCTHIPLLLEIKELIKAKKPTGQLPKQQETLVIVKVRGKNLVVRNSVANLQVALIGDFENKSGILTWLLMELEKG